MTPKFMKRIEVLRDKSMRRDYQPYKHTMTTEESDSEVREII
jgi:hypothetical protein